MLPSLLRENSTLLPYAPAAQQADGRGQRTGPQEYRLYAKHFLGVPCARVFFEDPRYIHGSIGAFPLYQGRLPSDTDVVFPLPGPP